MATLAGQLEKFDKACEKFELVASQSLDNQLTKWSVRDHLFKAALCHLATGDHIRARNAIEKFKNMDATFESTRECQLLMVIYIYIYIYFKKLFIIIFTIRIFWMHWIQEILKLLLVMYMNLIVLLN